MAGDPLKKGRYTKFGNKIGLYNTKDGNFISNTPEVVLNFPFKDAVLEGGMTKEDAGRDERFLNIEMDSKDIDALEDPKVLTNFKYIDKDGEKVLDENSDIEFFDENGDLKQNLLIKGNNLLALYTLREKLAGKVKLIYIDPPYFFKDTKNSDTFLYNPNFRLSTWLVFMRNRLEVAKTLLSDDGIIFVHINEDSLAYLKVLMDEIFDGTFVANLIWEKKTGASDAKNIATVTEYILCFEKKSLSGKFNKNHGAFDEKRYRYKDEYYEERGPFYYDNLERGTLGYHESLDYPIKSPTGTDIYPNGRTRQFNDGWRWKWGKDKLKWGIENGFIEIRKAPQKECGWGVYYKIYLNVDNEGKPIKKESPYKNLIQGILNTHATLETKNLFGSNIFSNPKPESLLKKILTIGSNPGDIILDFCLGSATTCAVAHKMHRRWIGIEQMDYIESISKARLKKVIDGEQGGISKDVNWQGGGSFVYFELKKYNQDFIDRIMAAASIPELEEIYEDMQKNAFLKFFFDKAEFEKDENFRNLDIYKRKEKLVDILDENQLYLNFDEMNDGKYHVTPAEKALTNRFYQANEEDEADNGEE